MKRLILTSIIGLLPSLTYATGLSFWESSTVNSSLASANGAVARDASVLALAPSSITQLESATVTANVTFYEVTTDYDIFGSQTEYEQSDPIPAGFFATPLNENWSAGLAMYSRTAADISIPRISVFIPLTDETRVRPITVSVAPSIAYRWNQISFAATLEYLYTDYELYQTKCGFRGCNDSELKSTTSGWSGALSSTWLLNPSLSLAINHKFATQYSDNNIDLDLPSITSLYATWSATKSLDWHFSYSYTDWKDKGIRYSDYGDPFGLLVGTRSSNRLASSLEYRLSDWSFRGGISADEAIDAFGGIDYRYRLGVGYRITQNLQADFSAVFENYAKKEYNTSSGANLISVQNDGTALGLGVSYFF